MRTVKRDKCGTNAGYQAHMRYGDVPCHECREAKREYTRKWRRSDPEVRERERLQNLARLRAWKRLADMHPTEFQALYAEESRDIPPHTYTRRELRDVTP